MGERVQTPRKWDGVVLTEARHDKETKHGELLESDRCQLVVADIEMGDGGRVVHRRFGFTRERRPRPSVFHRFSLGERGCRMLSVPCSRAFWGSLVSTADDQLTSTDGAALELAHLLLQFNSGQTDWGHFSDLRTLQTLNPEPRTPNPEP